MSDWQVGDLAVCVDTGIVRAGDGLDYMCSPTIQEGRTYTVTEVLFNKNTEGLRLRGLDGSWIAARFRKIRPDEHEQCEPEFVTLLKRIKVSA